MIDKNFVRICTCYVVNTSGVINKDLILEERGGGGVVRTYAYEYVLSTYHYNVQVLYTVVCTDVSLTNIVLHVTSQ